VSYCVEISENTVYLYEKLLRTKVETGDHPKLIHTVRGVGYMIRAEAEA